MAFAELCRSRGLEVPDIEYSVPQLADLVLQNEQYAAPVFAGFYRLALPIVSYWIEQNYEDNGKRLFDILDRLSILMPLIPSLAMVTEHFVAMHSSDLFKSLLAVPSLIRLLLHDYSRYALYVSAENLRELAGNAQDLEDRTMAIVALGLLMERSEGQIQEWLKEFVRDDALTDFEFNKVFRRCLLNAEDRKLLETVSSNMNDRDISEKILPSPTPSRFFVKIGGLYVPRFGGADENCTQYVETTSFLANTRAVAQCLLTDQPLLLMGEKGSGKTSIVEYIHQFVRNTELVRIHLGDQTDAKALIGNYTTGARPGTFEWTAGALTSAVKRGQWVLIEDIDKAPNDIVAVLLSLLTRRELVIPSRNQVVRAAPGFQIVATTSAMNRVDIIGQRSFATVSIAPPTNEDLRALILAMRPFLTAVVADMFVTVFRRVEEWQTQHSHNSNNRMSTTRDLVRLVNRIGAHYTSEGMFREAVTCFTSFLPDPTALAKVIGEAMNVPDSQVIPLLERFSPQVNLTDSRFVIGRAQLERRHVTNSAARNIDNELNNSKFALTQPTLQLMEEIAVGIEHAEPILLVGETGTGKTTIVQHIAKAARRKLVVINVSQQVEASDLIGGFKPVDCRQLAGPLLEEFNELFDATFSRAKNHQFLAVLEKTIAKQQWKNVVKLLREAVKMATKQAIGTNNDKSQGTSSEAKRIRKEEKSDWSTFPAQIDAFADKLETIHQAAQFQFIEGLLVRSLRQGHWVLLDELNLAPADTVEGISELLSSRSLTILENSGQVVRAHPQFRLFANMNPATDVGKRDLPMSVRTQFTEIWSPSPDSNIEALRSIIKRYLPPVADSSLVNDVAQLYVISRDLAHKHQLVDGAGQRPHFSIRTLSRMLVSATTISPIYGLRRSLYETFVMSFSTLLDDASSNLLLKEADKWLLEKLPNRNSAMTMIPPVLNDGRSYVQFQHWWMPMCSTADPRNMEQFQDSKYIITPSVERNLLSLVRATALKSYPVLIQGPTSSGKTSMISYLAKRTGHTVVRINNHEHTDLAEYMGGYESDADGRLIFKEGALVNALREGHWLVLDELNLAPTDVLEALNRLLDDNRELLVPETQEIIKPHPDFVLFATQNPPGIYAGRKILSRAFRNRFLELHFGDIPEQELEQIVRDRTNIAPSYAAKIVEVYRELGRQRIQRVFEQAATLRDLFRWAKRPAVGYEQLAFNGYCLLGERSRTVSEKDSIKSVIEKVMRVSIDTDIASLADPEVMNAAPPDIVWTKAMRRVLALTQMAIRQNEPVLLIGETGCGKTTIIQALAAAKKQNLIILNAHQNTETGDLVGSQRPVRTQGSSKLFEWVDGPLVVALKQGSFFLLDEISLADDSVLERLNSVLEPERVLFVPEIGSINAQGDFEFFSTMNPGGDYGKKELSPALRNRFTEIWVPTVDDESDLKLIVSQRLVSHDQESTRIIVDFSQWYSKKFSMVSLRDILSWVEFINAATEDPTRTDDIMKTVVHGAIMTFVDGLGARANMAVSEDSILRSRKMCIHELEKLAGKDAVRNVDDTNVSFSDKHVIIGGFALPLKSSEKPTAAEVSDFSLAAPTSALNAKRVVRAMQVKKPVLLEGSPGAGKTSLIAALAKLCGARLTRINLSDQTDLSDLFGQDVPLDEPGKFGWRSAPFLRAMQQGDWVLLDEMNLAPQPVLEGLNACLDHRGEAYIPELDRTFAKEPNFTVFAAQNPQGQGGGRKGLPKSFLNRFTVVYVDQLGLKDLHAIAAATHPSIDVHVRERLAEFVEELSKWSTRQHLSGGPFEFNLRDTLRWLDLINRRRQHPYDFLPMIVTQRLRSSDAKIAVEQMFKKYFDTPDINIVNPVDIDGVTLAVGTAKVSRTRSWLVHGQYRILAHQIPILETALQCVTEGWALSLVGDSGTGKSCIIKLLAQLCGSTLREFSMTPDIDSTDLLGEFDQLEFESECQQMWSVIADEVSKTLDKIEDSRLSDAIRSHNLDAVKGLLIPELHPRSVRAIAQFTETDFSKPIFKWVDGMLVRAVEQGEWVVLDNANLCSAAVLDRLNSLLERGGCLFVNECANSDGSPRMIHPHPDFRLFLTVNPKYGELSRAMRNRSVEVYLNERVTDDVVLMRGGRISNELSLRSSQPLTVAKLGDLTARTWIRSLALDNRTPLKYLSIVDEELAMFALSPYFTQTSFEELHEGWYKFVLDGLRKKAMIAAKDIVIQAGNSGNIPGEHLSLLSTSALHRVKDSVESEFDIYGFLKGVEVIHSNEDLFSILYDMAQVTDPSRIPVYRDWLIKYSEKHDLPELAQQVRNCLGKQYDFTDGGEGMELIWKRFGQTLGFSTKAHHDKFAEVLSVSQKFDSMVAGIGLEHAGAVSEIRLILSDVTSVDEPLGVAIEEFRQSLKGVSATKPLTLQDSFRALWTSLSLVYSINPSSKLLQGIAKLTTLAKLSTADIRSLNLVRTEPFYVAKIAVPPTLESVLINVLKSTQQGQAVNEVKQMIEIFATFGDEIMKSIHVSKLVEAIGMQTWNELIQICPSLSTKAFNSPLEIAIDLLRLYVCPLPLDPAIAQHVWYERYLKLLQEFSEDEGCWNNLEQLIGSNSTVVSNWLRSRTLNEEPVPSIWRPRNSNIAMVHRDMLAVAQLVKSAHQKQLSKEETELVMRNSDHLYDRLTRALEYRDLVAPVLTALCLLQLHLTMQQRNAHEDSSDLWLLDPVKIASGSVSVECDAGSISELPLLTMRSLCCAPEIPLAILDKVVSGVYQNWTMERLKLEEKQQEQNAGVRYIDDENEEAGADREFKMMFPDYDEIPDLPSREDTFLPEFVDTYCDLLSPNATKASLPDTLAFAANHLTVSTGQSAPSHIAALLLALHRRTLQQLDGKETHKINFYTDSSPAESSFSVSFAELTQTRVLQFLEIWPEHDTLQSISRIAQEVVELPPAAPVALHLSKIEQLHHNLYEWNRFASKDVLVDDLMAKASSLIVRWRKLELATWPALFLMEKKKAAMSAAGFWFHLYETLIFAPAADIADTAKILILFMSESPVGQYHKRLELLMAIETHLSLYENSNHEAVRRCLMNVRQYFEMFSSKVQRRLDDLEQQLRKKVDEVVKLASWRDVNIHALKQSAQRSHRQLFKYVKKFRELLQTCVVTEDLATALELRDDISPATRADSNSIFTDWVALATPAASTTEWKTNMPNRLRELSRISKSIDHYISEVRVSSATSLHDFASNVEEQTINLRKETPTKWTKENKKEISALKVEKQQLLTFTLRELKRSGLKQTVNKKMLADQMELTRVLAKSSNLTDTNFAGLESYFYAYIELLPRLRAAVSDAASGEISDVPYQDLQRGLSLGEDLFSHILRLRKIAHVHTVSSNDYNQCFRSLSELAQSPRDASYVQNFGQIRNAAHIIDSVSDLIEAAAHSTGNVTITAPELRSNASMASTITELMGRTHEARTWFEEVDKSISILDNRLTGTNAGPFISPILEDLRSKLAHHKSEIKSNDASTWDATSASIVSAANSVLVVIQDAVKLVDAHDKVTSDPLNDASVDQGDDDEEINESDWLITDIRLYSRLLLTLRSRELSERFNNAAELIFRYSKINADVAAGLAASLLVFFEGYQRLATKIEIAYQQLLESITLAGVKLSKLLYSLATTGFCSPKPLEADDEDDPSKGDGVGLGDGSGAQSSTKDIDEEDDDVAEAMQTENPDQEEREDDGEEDNAKEMQGDMAGEMEDAPPQNSDSEQSDAEDQEELDEEVGNLEDLDQNAIDEKMWDDQQPDTNEKEKQTDENLDGSNESDDEPEAGNDKESKQNQSLDDNADNSDHDAGSEPEDGEDEDMQDEEIDGEKEDHDQIDEGTEQKDALNLPDDMELDGDANEDDNDDDEPKAEDQIDASDDDEMDGEEELNKDVDSDGNLSNDDQDSANDLNDNEENTAVSDDEHMRDEAEEDDLDVHDANDTENDPESISEDLDMENTNEADEADGQGADIEGLYGPQDNQDGEPDDNQAINTEIRTESRGQGASEDAAAEQSNVGMGGTAGANQDIPEDESAAEQHDQQESNQIKESLRQLGDALEKFHRRQQDIREHHDDGAEDDVKASAQEEKPLQGDEEFEHVGAEDAYDTQALGKADQKLDQEIDQSMAIDDDDAGESDVINTAGDEDKNAENGSGAMETLAEENDSEESDVPHEDAVVSAGNRDDESDDPEEDMEPLSENAQDSSLAIDTKSQRDDLWQMYEAKVHDLTMMLGEQLRLILEPTVASKLRGDYRTGKRLNMKRIIPYIASEFRKDKIWLRRSKPAKREYQILLSLDDSKSMGEPAVVDLAFQAIALVGKALSMIEAGQVGIAKFGSTTDIIHPLDLPLTTQNGNAVLSQFNFNQPRTNVRQLLEKSLEMFSKFGNSNSEQWKLEIIVSDGIADDHQTLRKLVRQAYDERVMIVFVVLDALNKDASVLDMNEVRYTNDDQGNPKLEVVKYFDDFPFDYYVIVRNISDLPMVLANVLRQYFQAQQG